MFSLPESETAQSESVYARNEGEKREELVSEASEFSRRTKGEFVRPRDFLFVLRVVEVFEFLLSKNYI